MKPEKLEFFYGRLVVGYFDQGQSPHTPGLHHYVPYRSVGHYKLTQAVRSGDKPLCYYESGGTRVLFQVRDFAEYGVMLLDGFASEPVSKT